MTLDVLSFCLGALAAFALDSLKCWVDRWHARRINAVLDEARWSRYRAACMDVVWDWTEKRPHIARVMNGNDAIELGEAIELKFQSLLAKELAKHAKEKKAGAT
jgi:hypothetical protein